MSHSTAGSRSHRSAHQPSYHGFAAPLPYINPTRALYRPTATRSRSEDSHVTSNAVAARHASHHDLGKSPVPVTYKWSSRNNRKGRHAIAIDPSRIPSESQHLVPRPTSSLRNIGSGVGRMLTAYPVWDVSYDVAVIFTLGSVIWVFNAFFVWLPVVRPGTEFEDEESYGGGITAFIGATIFVVGSFLLMAEAVNENQTECFGWAVERIVSHDSEKASDNGYRLRASNSNCTHHHLNKSGLLHKGKATSTLPRPGSSLAPRSQSWIWFPSMEELRSHYMRELGFLASFTQLVAASIFWIAGFTALPGIYENMSRTVVIVLYWTPQVVGGSGFILSGALFMLETQSRWYKPAFRTLGWWVGFWNLIGGIGFTICPAFGYDEASWAQYQAGLSTFWASWAFLIGSVLQWYECLEKHPVEVDKSLGQRNDVPGESLGGKSNDDEEIER